MIGSGLRERKLTLFKTLKPFMQIVKVALDGFPDSSVGKEFAWNARYPGLIPGSGRSSGEGKGYPLHYSGLENSMDCTFQEFPKSWTRLSDFHFHVGYN